LSGSEPQSSEKRFYLQYFRHRAILFHLSAPLQLGMVRPILDELVENQTMVVVVSTRHAGRNWVRLTARDVARMGDGLARVSDGLVNDGVAFVDTPTVSSSAALRFSCQLSIRLGVNKLVVIDERGGFEGPLGVRSFVKASSLMRYGGRAQSDPALRDRAWRRSELRLLQNTIRDGVESINLTTPEMAEAELFTYEGAGTLITSGEYAKVEPLRAADFPQALSLIVRGEREGFLLKRSDAERARLLLCGYGAWFEGRRLAGIAAVVTEPYVRQKLAEVVGLYTITRFQGEGVGVRIIEGLVEVARDRGCRALVACTSNARAGAFFERNGFAPASPDALPKAKWKGRGSKRPAVFWRDL